MLSDYKSRELNLHRDDGYKFRIIPKFGDTEVPYAFELKTTNTSNNGNWGVYVESLFSSVGNVTQSVGGMLYSHANTLNTHTTDIANEVYSRHTGDVKLANDLFIESQTRASGDAVHTADIAAEVAARISGDYTLQQSLANETANRTAADTVHTQSIAQLGIDLAAESASRADHDTKIISDLNVQKDARIAGDAKLTTDLASESSARVLADSKLTSDLSAEVAARVADVANVNGRVDFVIHNTDPQALDSLSEIVAQFSANGSNFAARIAFLEGVVAELVAKVA